MPSNAPTVYSSEPSAIDSRDVTGTHLLFGTPCTST